MNNLRFATIIHILVLAHQSKANSSNCGTHHVITSDYIAGSININPVVVRREIKVLKDAGILDSKKGKEGGCYLIKPASSINFGELYQLVNQDHSFGKLNQTNPNCPIGKQMNSALHHLFGAVDEKIYKELSQTNLEDFSNQFDQFLNL